MGSRGPRFSPMEDMEICKAFIATSEDATVGTDQKGADFQKKMHDNYSTLLKNYNNTNGTDYSPRRYKAVQCYLCPIQEDFQVCYEVDWH
jgi:hypothetical protein